MKSTPPAVEVGPPFCELGAPVCTPGGAPSTVPNGICQAISPVLTSTAISLDQGGCQQGQPSTDIRVTTCQ